MSDKIENVIIFHLSVAPLVPVIIPLAIDRSLLVKRIDMNNSTSGL